MAISDASSASSILCSQLRSALRISSTVMVPLPSVSIAMNSSLRPAAAAAAGRRR
jgi:hypothetical protein